MPVKTWCCKKCGETFGYAYLRLHPTTRCPGCSEPDIELWGICWLVGGEPPEDAA